MQNLISLMPLCVRSSLRNVKLNLAWTRSHGQPVYEKGIDSFAAGVALGQEQWELC